jgi:uncharacterized CHY-type Zn-finger protein
LTRYRTYLLAMAVVVSIAVWLNVQVSEREPEVIRNALICPVCGKQLQRKDAPCDWCQLKKNREDIESKARGGSPNPETGNTTKTRTIVGIVALCILMIVVFWPQIQRFARSRQKVADVEYRVFRCPPCRRKLRYRATMIGTQGMCPTCKELFTFPEGEEATDDEE